MVEVKKEFEIDESEKLLNLRSSEDEFHLI